VRLPLALARGPLDLLTNSQLKVSSFLVREDSKGKVVSVSDGVVGDTVRNQAHTEREREIKWLIRRRGAPAGAAPTCGYHLFDFIGHLGHSKTQYDGFWDARVATQTPATRASRHIQCVAFEGTCQTVGIVSASTRHQGAR
jgi:hypothetical protein